MQLGHTTNHGRCHQAHLPKDCAATTEWLLAGVRRVCGDEPESGRWAGGIAAAPSRGQTLGGECEMLRRDLATREEARHLLAGALALRARVRG